MYVHVICLVARLAQCLYFVPHSEAKLSSQMPPDPLPCLAWVIAGYLYPSAFTPGPSCPLGGPPQTPLGLAVSAWVISRRSISADNAQLGGVSPRASGLLTQSC